MSDGNGSSKVNIDRVKMGEGWFYFEAGKSKPNLENLPLLLNRAMFEWLQEDPAIVVRNTLGIVADGVPLGIHVWYDVVEE
ncbi:MAG: hypothetical protein H8E44_20955 [Planctomycetes bacterium]|nr:hypothetical protein [Planctomycetota bacterium]MBL7043220.1 hypothetical protein [Pirellulaceae bacterium]